jgi:hypothetical protein
VCYPPEVGRRRKLRHWHFVALSGLLLVAAYWGAWYWQQTRFPARTVALPGTPVELRVQKGVQPRELRAVRRGLLLADRFMRRDLGRTVQKPVEARVARSNGCRPFESPTDSLVGEADHGFLCVATRNLHWRYLIQSEPAAATAVSAHEYVHVLQAELGCLSKGADQKYHWLMEGMADEIAWRALIADRLVSNARVAGELRRDAIRVRGAYERGLNPLPAYERGDGADREYALWHMAVRRLVHVAVRAGAAPPDRPEISLKRFCERVGGGLDWRSAFDRSFGEPVGAFYADFAAFRHRMGDTRPLAVSGPGGPDRRRRS